MNCVRGAAIVALGLLMTVSGSGQARQSHKHQPSPRRQVAPTLYERIDAKLERDPELARRLSAPPAELERVNWLVGRWAITARVFATARTAERVEHGEAIVELALDGSWLSMRDTYPGGTQDQGFLTYSVASQSWVSLSLDSSGTAIVATSAGWVSDRLVFVAHDVAILGERVTLRQTLEKRSETEYRVLNEERVGSDRWVALDEYVYTKLTVPN